MNWEESIAAKCAAIERNDAAELTRLIRSEFKPHHIPAEMLDKKRWFVWSAIPSGNGKFSKVPHDKESRKRGGGDRKTQGSAGDIASMMSGEAAIAKWQSEECWAGIGFAALGEQYSFIDFDRCLDVTGDELHYRDDRVAELVQTTRAEVSPSGLGIRLIFEGELPAGRGDLIEVYHATQFLTITGDVLAGGDDKVRPIAKVTPKILRMVAELMGEAKVTLPGKNSEARPKTASGIATPDLLPVPRCNDIDLETGRRQLLDELGNDGTLTYDAWFKILCAVHHQFGDAGKELAFEWSDLSPLGQERAYFDEKWKSIGGYTGQRATWRWVLKLLGTPPAVSGPAAKARQAPQRSLPAWPAPFPGVMADLVEETLRTCRMRQPELALIAVLVGMAAGLNGRYHFADATRCNLYALGISRSGRGKDFPKRVAKRLARLTGATLIGKPASGEALEETLVAAGHFGSSISVIDEIAFLLEAVQGSRAPSHLQNLSANLLEMFSVSADEHSTRRLAERASKIILHPCLSILGFATPDTLGKALNSGNITNGLLGRMLLAPGRDAPDRNRVRVTFDMPQSAQDVAHKLNAFAPIPTNLSRQMALAQVGALELVGTGLILIDETGVEAELDALDDEMTAQAHACEDPTQQDLLARTFEKTRHIAGVVAVWENPTSPGVTREILSWAAEVARASDGAMAEFIGWHVHDGVVQADAAKVIALFDRILAGKVKPDRASEIRALEKGYVACSLLLRRSKLDKQPFDHAIDQLVAQGDLVSETLSSEVAGGKGIRVVYVPEEVKSAGE